MGLIIQKIVFILFSFYLFTTSEQIQVESFDKNYKGKYLRLAKSFPLTQKEWRKLRTSIGNNRRKRVKKTTIYVDNKDEGKISTVGRIARKNKSRRTMFRRK